MSDYISEELLFPILKRLAAKTLLRCRCVCKTWKQLIDSKSFILDHLAVQSPRILAQTIHESKYMIVDLSRLTLPLQNEELLGELLTLHSIQQDDSLIDHIQHPEPYVFVAGITHGVICLYYNENLLLWNPSIRHHLRLPPPNIRPFAHDSCTLAYDVKCCGFWIHDSLNYFKIVILFPAQAKFAVFSSVNQAWVDMSMESNRIMDDDLAWSGDPQILIDGVVYWKLYDSCHISVDVITYFDFGQDKLGTIELPRIEDVEHRSCIIKWHNCVAFIHWQELFPFGCDLWAMQNGSWSKVFSLNLPELTDDVWYVDEEYSRVLAKSNKGDLLLFDPHKDGCIRRLKCSSILPGYVTWVCTDFAESLVFPAQVSI